LVVRYLCKASGILDTVLKKFLVASTTGVCGTRLIGRGIAMPQEQPMLAEPVLEIKERLPKLLDSIEGL